MCGPPGRGNPGGGLLKSGRGGIPGIGGGPQALGPETLKVKEPLHEISGQIMFGRKSYRD